MRLIFVSNYINHHQIPFCREAESLLGKGNFLFFQTCEMDSERRGMGWKEELPDYVRLTYDADPARSEQLRRDAVREIRDADVVLFGGCEEEAYIRPRLDAGKLTFRYSERVYKTGQWKCVTPRGLRRKYLDHTAYRHAPVYLLCAGGYVASDFGIFRSYPEKMLRWGYFPEIRRQDLPALFARKEENAMPRLLWAGRMIDWKHAERAIHTAEELKKRGAQFLLELAGGGTMEAQLKQEVRDLHLEDVVRFAGVRTPEGIRELMEQSDIFLFTSDRQEGWGAVANEAMNSGCALIMDAMIGAAPYLAQNGVNAFVYPDGHPERMTDYAERLIRDPSLRRQMGENAYETVWQLWNPQVAARRLLRLAEEALSMGEKAKEKAPVLWEDGGPLSAENPRAEGKIATQICSF
ncbi:MAG: glycosyltransferase family 4 protein [Lachnospiraceae bacterium]|nr:glycosyltransferase family 4 protein [Lachnospiraceae bacterium]